MEYEDIKMPAIMILRNYAHFVLLLRNKRKNKAICTE